MGSFRIDEPGLLKVKSEATRPFLHLYKNQQRVGCRKSSSLLTAILLLRWPDCLATSLIPRGFLCRPGKIKPAPFIALKWNFPFQKHRTVYLLYIMILFHSIGNNLIFFLQKTLYPGRKFLDRAGEKNDGGQAGRTIIALTAGLMIYTFDHVV